MLPNGYTRTTEDFPGVEKVVLGELHSQGLTKNLQFVGGTIKFLFHGSLSDNCHKGNYAAWLD